MRRKEMAELLRRYTVRLELLARRIAAHYKEEDIHSFRLLVKKLRAFIRLTSPAAESRRLPKRLHAFYKAVGTIRNLQVQCDGLQRTNADGNRQALDTLVQRLHEEMKEAEKSAHSLLHPGKHPFGNLEAKLTAALPARLNQAHRHRFLSRHLQVLDPATFPQLPDDERLHTLRKSIKDLLYTWPWLGNRGRKLAAVPLGGHKSLKKAGVLLGDYLDNRLQLRLLIGQDATSPATYTRLRDDWAEEKASLRRQIDHSLGRRLHFATQPHFKSPENPQSPLSGNSPTLSNELHLD